MQQILSLPLRISPAGSRFGHARKTAQVVKDQFGIQQIPLALGRGPAYGGPSSRIAWG